MHFLEPGRGYTTMADGSSTKSHRKGGLIGACSKLDQSVVAIVLRVTTWGTRSTNSSGVGTTGKRSATAKGEGLRTKSVVAQTYGT